MRSTHSQVLQAISDEFGDSSGLDRRPYSRRHCILWAGPHLEAPPCWPPSRVLRVAMSSSREEKSISSLIQLWTLGPTIMTKGMPTGATEHGLKEITNPFDWNEGPLHKLKLHTWHCYHGQGHVDRQILVSRCKPNAIILLMGLSIKCIFNDLLPHRHR